MKPETRIISRAMYELAETIQSGDGVANAAIAQAAERLDMQTVEITVLKNKLIAAENSIDALKCLIPIENQRDILIDAFRHTLGRKTYAPHTVIGVIFNSWNQISAHDRKLIQREIKEAIERGRAGMEFDAKAWATLLELPSA